MSKKSETVEIRLSHDMKQRLSAVAQSRGETMSGLIRDAVSAQCLATGGMHTEGNSLMKTLKLSALGLAFVATTALGGTALILSQSAAIADGSAFDEFLEMDLNEDQTISRAEYDHAMQADMLSQAMPATDTTQEPAWPEACNADLGVLEATDGDAEGFKRLDLNADGNITRAEFNNAVMADIRAMIARADTDADGELNAEELANLFAADAPELSESDLDLSPACTAALKTAGAGDTAGVETLATDDGAQAGTALADLDEAAGAELDVKAEVAEMLAEYDLDGNGRLDAKELAQF